MLWELQIIIAFISVHCVKQGRLFGFNWNCEWYLLVF